MREPERYRVEVDVNWGAAILLLPFILMMPESWGGYFEAVAVLLLFAAVTRIIKLW
jgi:hypothetical protein